jgi:hypothetical protein
LLFLLHDANTTTVTTTSSVNKCFMFKLLNINQIYPIIVKTAQKRR